MSYSTLQGEVLTGNVHWYRVLRACLRGLEAQMVIAVTDLGGHAGLHDIDLRSNAIGGAKPRIADESQPWVRVVLNKGGWLSNPVLVEGIPNPVILAAACEVIALGRGAFRGDYGLKYTVYLLQKTRVLVHVHQDQDTWAGE